MYENSEQLLGNSYEGRNWELLAKTGILLEFLLKTAIILYEEQQMTDFIYNDKVYSCN